MQENELNFYDKIGNWDFSMIKYSKEHLTNWNFYKKIQENVNEKSICLDLGTGGGEKLLSKYPNAGLWIGTDFSKEMLQTAKKNLQNYPKKNVKFVWMDNLNMTFPNEMFDLISARHTIIDAQKIYDCLDENGVLVIEGIDQKDCWDLKEIYGKGQAYNDEIPLSKREYEDLKNAGFEKIECFEVLQNEYYETIEDLVALLLKTPILDDFSEIHENEGYEHIVQIDMDLLKKYVSKNTTEKGILLKRVLYGIVAKK